MRYDHKRNCRDLIELFVICGKKKNQFNLEKQFLKRCKKIMNKKEVKL